MKILVADDSKTNLALITDSLEKLGHEVMPATSGSQAIEMFRNNRPDLVILDVVMEGMDGFECAKGIRLISEDSWIPIIFLSGSVDDASIAKGIDAGGDDYLTKPFSEVKLAAKIKAMQRISTMRKELFDATQKLTKLSSTDSLTGVYNRFQFNKIIREKIAMATRKKGIFALLFLDLDKFKLINDTQGHLAGDQLLIQVTQRLSGCLRAHDFLARMGGDEFAIILSDIDNPQQINTVCQKIVSTLSSAYMIEGESVQTSCSIGIVLYPTDGKDTETLSKKADIAMYAAKNAGRNNYKYFVPDMLKENHQEDSHKKLPEDSSQKHIIMHCLVETTQIGIELDFVKKNLPLMELTPLPNSPNYLVGVMNLAGESIPVIDLSARLNFPKTHDYSIDTPMVLCADGTHQIAFIVDKIIGIDEVAHSDLQMQAYNQEPDSFFLATINRGSTLSLLLNMPYLLAIHHEYA